MGKFKLKNIILLSGIVLVLGIIFSVSRGPHVSNLLKRLILPELSLATGRQVMAQKIYINIFPLFIEAKELKVSEGGSEILHVPRIKGYIGLFGLLRKEVVLKRLVIKEPAIKSNALQAEDIIRKIKEYISKERESQVKVIVKRVVLNDGRFTFGYRDASFTGSGFSGEAVLNASGKRTVSQAQASRISFSLKDVISKVEGWPELKGNVKGTVVLKGDVIDVKALQIGLSGSLIDASGSYPLDVSSGEKSLRREEDKGSFKMQMNLLAESFKKVFGLKQRGEGMVFAKGTLNLKSNDILNSTIDMELKGDFYIQTLMELLKVDERVEGLVDFTGSLTGPLANLKGTAKARLQDGNLFGVDLNELRCNISYSDYMFNFRDGKAVLYNGHAEADAALAIHKSKHYSLSVKFSDVDSPAALNLIGWRPEIPSGKVRGELKTSGERFDPYGWFDYESRSEGQDVLGRVRRIKGSYSLKGNILTILNSEARTGKSVLTASGDLDIESSFILSLGIELKTADVTDMTLPFLHELNGSGEFSGKVRGKFENPSIDGRIKLSEASYDGYYLGNVIADVGYKKDLLEVRNLSAVAAEHDMRATAAVSGSVRFENPEGLFDFRKPMYSLSVSVKNAYLDRAVRFVYKKTLKKYPEGRFNADFTVTGKGPQPLYQGSISINDVRIDKFIVDSASLLFSYNYNDFLIKDAVLRRGSSALAAEGRLSHDDMFSFKASGSRIFLKDINLEGMPVDAYITLKAEGKGRLDDPVIDLSGVFYGGKINGTDVGDGKVKASLRDWNLSLDSSLFDNRVTLRGKAYLKGDMPWTARLDVSSGRYDFLLNAFLKDRPEDLLVNMKGYADMSGDRNHFSAAAVVNQLNVTLFGYSFSNEADISFGMKDKKLYLPMVKMRSGSTSFKVSGNMEISRGYDIVIEGSSALSPVKGFFKRIDTIRGDTEFVFSITGAWDNPKVNGGVTVSNAFFGLKDIPHRISSINGYFYIDEDKIVVQKLSGKAGGGDVDISGVAYLKRFRIRNFYLDAVLNDISVNVSKDFPVNFNGNILYKGTLDSQTIGGEIRINRAKYRERVEWKSWLFRAKPKERPRGEIGALERAVLNIKVYGSDNITVDNNIARTSLKVDMLLRGTVLQPLLFGRIESKTGTVYFRNNEFRILNASADFSDPRRINPVMEITAETSIKSYKIRMNLEGQTDQFTLSLTSDPPLEEIDILSLLTVGRLGKELKGIEGGVGAGEATSFLTGRVQDVLEERVTSLTGLDRVEVDPYVSKTTGTVSPRITVSKRLMGDKLFVTYSSAVGSTENNVLKLEYILSKNISLIGIRDERGSVGSDIKFRFEFK